MINGNVAFKKQIKKVNYADITLRDGTVLKLEPCDFALGKFSMKDETTSGKFGVGNAVGKTINITIANHTDKFSMYDFFKSIIYMYVSVTLEDGTVLKERKGKYYVIEPASTGEVINLQGVDSMTLFDKPYNANTVYPATLQTILSDCCLGCGVNIGFGEFDNYNFIVNKKPEDCTYRQVVSWVSQIAGYNARISNNDYLELVWYDMESLSKDVFNGGNLFDLSFADTYDGGDFETYNDSVLIDGGYFTEQIPENISRIKTLKVSTDDVVITGVKVKNGKTEVLVGSEDYCLVVSGNDLTIGQENTVANYLAQRLVGLQFRPLTCEIPNNPLIEPYDLCYVNDRKGNSYFTLINSVSYSLNGFTTIQCKADDPVRSEKSYTSESAKAIAQIKRYTVDELTTYDKAVQNMNLLSANAMGLYRETEKKTAGDIYYMSNKPITKNADGICQFIADSFVYKMTGDGFFVSTDGGKTYTSGFDAQGNVVVNVLSAIGITFDWAKGGTLTLGGDNDINGSMNVLDKEGNVVGKFNNEGLWAKNGYFEGIIKSKDAEITGGYINIETSTLDYSAIKLRYDGNVVEISPHMLRIGGDYGVSVTDDYICLGSTSSSYTWIEEEGISVRTSLFTSSLTNEGIKLMGTDYYQSNGDFDVSTTYLNIHSSSLSTYGIETSKNVKFTGSCYFDGSTHICNTSYDSLSFFGGNGSTKQTVSKITSTSSATASSNATKINEIITALNKYNLI